jgi:hypothetical protein
MNPTRCAELADRLPDWAAARLPSAEAAEVGAHVATCADCAAQVTALRAVLAARPPVPADLAARIGAALRAEAEPARRPRHWAQWAGSAAAVLVLAVGTFVLRPENATEPLELGTLTADESVWIADDGIVAGAPLLDDLSDDALATLLEEME